MTFTVYGKTATKGSTRSFLKRGRIVTMADNKNLGAWTQAAKWAARQEGVSIIPKPGAVRLTATFQFVRPPSVKGRPHHTVKPDADKLLRAVLDALTGVAYEDDSQVIDARASKVYGPSEQCTVDVEEVG